MTTTVTHSFIAGEAVGGAATCQDVNPSDLSDLVSEIALIDANGVQAAVDAAGQASAAWAASTGHERALILDRAGEEVLRRRDELGDQLAREEGKTLAEGIAEVVRSGQILKYHAGEAVRDDGRHLGSVRPGVDVVVTREPVGIVALITPWNFPMAIPAWKLAPALAHGNTVVFKPSVTTPMTAWSLVEILHRAGLSNGVLNMVLGHGSDIGPTLVASPSVDAVSFTGSMAIGEEVRSVAAAHGARVQLEMGGKNALVILADADLENAVECAVRGAFYSTGQRCTASSRLVVERSIHAEFVDRLIARMGRLEVDDARKPATDIGPVIDEPRLLKNEHYLDAARAAGRVVVGGRRLERATEGWYFEPAVVLDTDRSDVINRDEVFGPIASVVAVHDYDEALDVANDTPFGLTAGICTTSLSKATHFRRQARAGMVMVNLPTAGVDFHVPFGGRGASSYGPREQGYAARDFYTVSKTTYIAAGSPHG